MYLNGKIPIEDEEFKRMVHIVSDVVNKTEEKLKYDRNLKKRPYLRIDEIIARNLQTSKN